MTTGTLPSASLDALAPGVRRLRGDGPADLSIVVPVSARDDLERFLDLLGDLCSYQGARRIEVVAAVNRYEREQPPAAVDQLRAVGVTVVAEPDAFQSGEIVCFSARMLAVRAAEAAFVVSLDADCRVPDPTALLDWYADRLEAGDAAAYTHIRYDDLRPMLSVRARVASHHASRYVKRRLLGIPTLRGGNFATRRDTLIALQDEGAVGDELSLGPLLRARGHAVAYSGRRARAVVTSGRWMLGGWRRLAGYLRYRLRYNRLALRTDPEGIEARRAVLHQEDLR